MKPSTLLQCLLSWASYTTAFAVTHQCFPFEKVGSEGPNASLLKVTSNTNSDVHVLVYALRDTVNSNLPFDATNQLPEVCTNKLVSHGQCTEEDLGKFVLKGDINEHVINKELASQSAVTYEIKKKGLYCVYGTSEGAASPLQGGSPILRIEEQHSYVYSHLTLDEYNDLKILGIVYYIECGIFLCGILVMVALKKWYNNDKVSLTNSFYAFGLLLFSSLRHNSQYLILQSKDFAPIEFSGGLEVQSFFAIQEVLKLLTDYFLVLFIFKWSILKFGKPGDFDERETKLYKNIRFCYMLYASAGVVRIIFRNTNIASNEVKALTGLFYYVMMLYVIIKVYKSFNATHVHMIEKGEDPVIISKFRKTSLMFKLLPFFLFTVSLFAVFIMSYQNAKLYTGSSSSFSESMIHVLESMIRTDFWYGMLIHLTSFTYIGITLGLVGIWRPVKVVDGEIKLAEDSDFGQLSS
ncbi:hypothetical protein WICPIJ_002764 [Wickerhamomyces pijperi]|uniref:PTM1-like N-terminal domain-containing protein n=1 Tax=Wickerhamomyces pijperi TaxID=599730 RepID=A0A9P8Q8E1_WICPI|nr:hypothetical protein WICPIJ_002764 [Wickerhamomyces pijperi]